MRHTAAAVRLRRLAGSAARSAAVKAHRIQREGVGEALARRLKAPFGGITAAQIAPRGLDGAGGAGERLGKGLRPLPPTREGTRDRKALHPETEPPQQRAIECGQERGIGAPDQIGLVVQIAAIGVERVARMELDFLINDLGLLEGGVLRAREFGNSTALA